MSARFETDGGGRALVAHARAPRAGASALASDAHVPRLEPARPRCRSVEFLGLRFDDLSLAEALETIDGFVRERTPRRIFTPNVALLMWSRKDPFLRRVYRSCDVVTVDGMAIYYALHMLGDPVQVCLSASLIFHPLLALAQARGYRVYLLGAKEPILRRAVDNLGRQFPGIRIVGAHDGYFDVADAGAVVADIRRASPDILLLGMSTPLKERFAERYLKEMGVPVTIGVGGMFDIAAGVARFAPPWIRRLCLEWLYRLVQEPRRLWRRYLTTNFAFLWLVQKEVVRRRVFRRAPGPRWRPAEPADGASET
jgi:N-acetylglucosaminyldiphosphoundecaprenol N-acetyl-beta-D-mannosaminyltransferase